MEQPRTEPTRAIALFTYSTKPRGGVVHTLSLAEHLHAFGHEVHIYALGKDQQQQFFRPTPVPFTLVPCDPPSDDETLEARIERYIDSYYEFLVAHEGGRFDVYHAQDCVSANALWRLRSEGRIPHFVRTVHHVDDFTSPSLIECQNRSILEPDYRIVVSRYWQRRLADEFDVDAVVIYNGVDTTRFRPANRQERRAARAEFGLDDAVTFLHIGGIEPRKNSIRLLQAFQTVKRRLADRGRDAVLLLAGGETLLDHTPYRQKFFEVLEHSDLRPDEDVLLPGVVSDAELLQLYRAADVFVFPSVKEGWGLVVLEAMASGIPVLASDLPVFREYLHSDENAVLVTPFDRDAIAEGMMRLVEEEGLRRRLADAGPTTAETFRWAATARAHLDFYDSIGRDESMDGGTSP